MPAIGRRPLLPSSAASWSREDIERLTLRAMPSRLGEEHAGCLQPAACAAKRLAALVAAFRLGYPAISMILSSWIRIAWNLSRSAALPVGRHSSRTTWAPVPDHTTVAAGVVLGSTACCLC